MKTTDVAFVDDRGDGAQVVALGAARRGDGNYVGAGGEEGSAVTRYIPAIIALSILVLGFQSAQR